MNPGTIACGSSCLASDVRNQPGTVLGIFWFGVRASPGWRSSMGFLRLERLGARLVWRGVRARHLFRVELLVFVPVHDLNDGQLRPSCTVNESLLSSSERKSSISQSS